MSASPCLFLFVLVAEAALEVPTPWPRAVRGVRVIGFPGAVLAELPLLTAVGAAPLHGHHLSVPTLPSPHTLRLTPFAVKTIAHFLLATFAHPFIAVLAVL